MSSVSTHLLAGSLLVLATGSLTGCSGSIGVDEEEQLGDEYAAEIRQQVPVIDDAASLAYIQEIGLQLIAPTDDSGRDYTFYLVDSPEINAFAIPGGHVFVHTGLVERADELSEFAGVLGHEIAHVVERHGIEQVERQQQGNMVLGLIYMLLGRQPDLLEQVVIQGGGAAIFAKYGRDAEREADQRAVQMLVSAGFHPEGMATFFEELMLESRRSPILVEQIFSTHPTSEERIENARATIETLGELQEESLLRDTPEYQQFRARVASLR
jgi:beta-barrel assembly-enhancing protease